MSQKYIKQCIKYIKQKNILNISEYRNYLKNCIYYFLFIEFIKRYFSILKRVKNYIRNTISKKKKKK